MTFARRLCALSLLSLLLLPLSTVSQELDGPTHIFRDTLLDNMTGTWNLTGKILGRTADHVVQGEWVVNHQFFRIRRRTNTPPPTSPSRTKPRS